MPISNWLKWTGGWAAGLATTAVLGLGVIYSGAFNATATKPHEPLVAWATHTAFINSVRLRAGAVHAPDHVDRSQILAGLRDYDQSCRACHGGPGIGRATDAAEMVPTPPYLLDAARQWTPAQLYWIIHNGVKMTAMPAWGESQTDAEVWNLVAFIEAMPKMPPADYVRLVAADKGQLPPDEAQAALDEVPPLLPLPKRPEFPPWLNFLSEISLALGILSAVVIIQDLVRRPQGMWIMNLVWPLTALFGGLIWLGGYYIWGRARPDQAYDRPKPPFAVSVAVAASHCGAGCTLGDIIAEWLVFVVPTLAVAFGWNTLFSEKTFAVWIFDYIVAFVLGIGFQYFTIKPMRKLSPPSALRQALKADAASITAWQIGMYGLMAVLQFGLLRPLYGQIASVDSVEFWFAMQLAMLAGFCTAYPVNWWLIRSGVKEPMQ